MADDSDDPYRPAHQEFVPTKAPPRRTSGRLFIAGTVVLLLAVGLFFWWYSITSLSGKGLAQLFFSCVFSVTSAIVFMVGFYVRSMESRNHPPPSRHIDDPPRPSDGSDRG